ncbi:hypothetical protein TSUD_180700 [Trifolium subterraneum]|uniref:Uncharacterized protein n=1 Tax=Trifolium subterraneum TaxID=3900 RepID=A0A2Z6NR93_TRISU|nr:hypothetical protein TSUD_180700 [Trifolium subterraneum]
MYKEEHIKDGFQQYVEAPIRPGIFIGNPKDGISWVDFSVNPRGPWLRSNIYGRRVNDKRNKRFNSNPMQSVSGGAFSLIPKAMLDMLAKMSLEEENEEVE